MVGNLRHFLNIGFARVGLIWLFLGMGLLFNSPTPTQAQDGAIWLWEVYPAGSVVYAEVVEVPDAVYRQVVPNSPPEAWVRTENTFLFDAFVNVSAHYQFLNLEHVVRLRIYDHTWGMILPDNRYSPYLPNPASYHPTYVKLDYLRPMTRQEFAPITIFPDTTKNVDKLIVVIADAQPRMVLFEGATPILHVPVVIGQVTPVGDFRVYRTRVSDDMADLPGVPFSNYFEGGYTIHGSPWWNWRGMAHGGYGSHGCVNVPDAEWYQIEVDGRYISVDEWVYRWISTNIDYNEEDPTIEEARIFADAAWYQATGSLRVIVVDHIDGVWNNVMPYLLGGPVRDAQIRDWDEIISAYQAMDSQWLITHIDGEKHEFEYLPRDVSIAQAEAELLPDEETWVMLQCSDRANLDNPAYEGSSRTVGQMCSHLWYERQGSICTPERVDADFIGKRILCDADRLNKLPLRTRGAIVAHERVHQQQFAGYFGDLISQGVAIDDLSIGDRRDWNQLSSIGVTELMAQTVTIQEGGEGYYSFITAVPTESGAAMHPLNLEATTQQAWDHLHRECGDPTLQDEALQALLERGLMGEKDAYLQLVEICSAPPHRLIPDRWRKP